MLLIIIGIFLIILSVVIYDRIISSNLTVSLMLLGVVTIIIGLFVPLDGYEEYEVIEKAELLPISGLSVELKEEQDFYVVDSNMDVYFICTQRPAKGILKVIEKYEGSNVEIIYSDEYVVKECRANAKKSIWSLALFNYKTRYEICVPEKDVLKIIY